MGYRLAAVLCIGLGLLFLAVQPSVAQQAATTVDALVVVGSKPKTREEVIANFVSTVSVKTGTGQMGRWDKAVCISVTGLRPDYADIIGRRIAATAAEVGLAVEPAGCKPNLIVVATDNANLLLAESIKKRRLAFIGNEGTVEASGNALREFAASDAAVRWWFVVSRVMSDGTPYAGGTAGSRASVVEVDSRAKAGLFARANVRADFNHVFIILDVSRIRTIQFSALADYIAMVSLVQTDPDVQFADVPTILRLFSDRAVGITPAEGFTDWDRALLKGLYSAKRNPKHLYLQEREIARTIAGALPSSE